jgi:hypothetical protein
MGLGENIYVYEIFRKYSKKYLETRISRSKHWSRPENPISPLFSLAFTGYCREMHCPVADA